MSDNVVDKTPEKATPGSLEGTPPPASPPHRHRGRSQLQLARLWQRARQRAAVRLRLHQRSQNPKAKSAGKTVMKKLKRPAAATPPPKGKGTGKGEKGDKGDKGSNQVMKKPAQQGSKDFKTWQTGLEVKAVEDMTQDQEEAEEEKDFEDDKEVDFAIRPASEKTDRSKKQKFLKLVSAGSLPSYLINEWNKTLKMKAGRTELQRTIINSAFDRTECGKLLLSLAKPVFQQMRDSYTDRSSSDTTKTLPRSLFQGKFSMDDTLFARGLAAGDFIEVQTADGKTAYQWASSEHRVVRGDRSSHGYKAEIEGTQEDAAKFESVGWKKGLFIPKGDSSSSHAISNAQQPLPLCDGSAAPENALTQAQWETAQSQLRPAIDAFEQQHKTGLKMLQLIGCDRFDDELLAKVFLGCT